MSGPDYVRAVRERNCKFQHWRDVSAAEIVQAAGYDKAARFGFLEEYKDALGVNAGRASDAWDKRWSRFHV